MSYADASDFEETGLPAGALAGLASSYVTAALKKASAVADSYLRDQYTLPLSEPYDPALVDAVVQIAAWRLLCRRGFNATTPGDATVRMGYEDSIEYLKRIANGQVRLSVVQSAPEQIEPRVISGIPRGYSAPSDPLGPYDGGL